MSQALNTTEEALDQYLAAPDGTCFHNTVWGSNQLCTGPYFNTNLPPYHQDGTSARYGTSCYQAGGDSTNGTGCLSDCPDLVHPEADISFPYYGTDSAKGCDNATAEACGTVQCHYIISSAHHAARAASERQTSAHPSARCSP